MAVYTGDANVIGGPWAYIYAALGFVVAIEGIAEGYRQGRVACGGLSLIEWHPGELYPRFIVTNMSRPAERVVASRAIMAHPTGEWNRMSTCAPVPCQFQLSSNPIY